MHFRKTARLGYQPDGAGINPCPMSEETLSGTPSFPRGPAQRPQRIPPLRLRAVRIMASRSSSLTPSLADGTDPGLRRFLLNFVRFVFGVRDGRALELDHFHLQTCLVLLRRHID